MHRKRDRETVFKRQIFFYKENKVHWKNELQHVYVVKWISTHSFDISMVPSIYLKIFNFADISLTESKKTGTSTSLLAQSHEKNRAKDGQIQRERMNNENMTTIMAIAKSTTFDIRIS